MDTHTPTATPLAATILTTADGDAPTGATLGGPQQVLANALRDLQNKVDPATSPAGASPIPRLTGSPLCPTGGNATIAENADVDATGACVGVNVTGTYFFRIDFDPPNGAELVSVRAYVYDPGTLAVRIYCLDHQVPVDVGGDIDEILVADELASATSATVIAGPMHYVTVNIPAGHIVDRTAKSYYARISGDDAGDTFWFDRVRVVSIPATADLGAG